MNCSRGKPYEALHVAELTSNQFVGIKEVLKKYGNSTFLYISYDYDGNIYLWVLKQEERNFVKAMLATTTKPLWMTYLETKVS